MALKFFHVPCRGGVSEEADLNGFLRGHRVLSVQRELVTDGAASYWALCVDFLDSGADAAAPGAIVPFRNLRKHDPFPPDTHAPAA